MASIRLTQFAGLMPELSAKLKRKDNAQIAHNCLLYDGRLRAMPAYHVYQNSTSGQILSLYRAYGTVNVFPDYEFNESIYLDGSPFPTGVFGVGPSFAPCVKFGPPGVSGNVLAASVGPLVIDSSPILNLTPQNLSSRPSVVSYAATVVRKSTFTNNIEESAPVIIGTVGLAYQQLFYEGDVVQLFVTFNALTKGETFFRLYRTISGLESGEKLTNPFDTDWFLVDEFAINDVGSPVLSYIDNLFSSQLRGDLLLSEGNMPPSFRFLPPKKVGLTESGWLWATTSYEIQFTERYRWHSWSLSSYLVISNADTITDATAFYDTLFIGTTGKPYKATVTYSNEDVGNIDPMSVSLAPFPEYQPCIERTLVTAPFGALYTSSNGVVALENERMSVITRDLLNAGDVLYKWCDGEFKFSDITYATWFNGWYIGYGGDKAFVYQAPEDLNDAHPFQQLITMDVPNVNNPNRPYGVIGQYGLHFSTGQTIYYWPVPGWVRTGDTPHKLTYKWKSKKFVMPGFTNFAAGKVVFECDGDLCFKLMVDCRCVFTYKVTDCQPFRLPSSSGGVEFEIEMEGTATVSEVHIASSMHELVEVETE